VSAEAANGGTLSYRVGQLERRMDTTSLWRDETAQSLAARNVEFSGLKEEVAALRADVKGLRQVLIGLACTIAGSSVVFGMSILIATGKI
jgi:hypothetical protein